MDWARNRGAEPILPTTIGAKSAEPEWEDLSRINAQMQVVLVVLCRDEAMTIVRYSAKGQGLDEGGRLNREYDPNNEVANLRLLKLVLHPAQQPVENLRGSLETWGRNYQMYCDRTPQRLGDPVRRLTLQSMCPPALREHLDFHVARLGTYDCFGCGGLLCRPEASPPVRRCNRHGGRRGAQRERQAQEPPQRRQGCPPSTIVGLPPGTAPRRPWRSGRLPATAHRRPGPAPKGGGRADRSGRRRERKHDEALRGRRRGR